MVQRTPGDVVHPFEGLSNFRDVGDLGTVDGHAFKTGVLFRSERRRAALTELTSSVARWMAVILVRTHAWPPS